MWDLIVSVPDHCLSFYFLYVVCAFIVLYLQCLFICLSNETQIMWYQYNCVIKVSRPISG